jgi:transcriptional regulator with XRE-family HTH domain
MAKELGCTYAYVAQLRCGGRKTANISQGFAENAAAYLGLPPAVVKLLSGQLNMSDFLPPQRSREDEVREGLEHLRNDAAIGAYLPPELFDAAPTVQEFVWRLFQECSYQHPQGMRALPRALDYLRRATRSEESCESEIAQLRAQLIAISATFSNAGAGARLAD